jgi:hypothetical protein
MLEVDQAPEGAAVRDQPGCTARTTRGEGRGGVHVNVIGARNERANPWRE